MEEETQTSVQEAIYERGRLNVNFDEQTAQLIEEDLASGGIVTKASSPGIAALYGELGIESLERLFPYAGEYEPRTRAEGLHRWYKVTYKKTVSVTKASEKVEAIPGVIIAEPEPAVKISSYFNDPYAKYQWHYHNDGTLSSKHKSGADINVLPVWQNYTVGSEKVIVSVVDGGIDYGHEDLADAYAGGRNFVSGGKVTAHTHGTHVAGTIGAVSNNGKGVEGIAGGDASQGIKGVRLLSCQIFETSSDGSDNGGDSATAIKWGADNGAVISQNSWGYDYDSNNDGKLTGSEYEAAMAATISSAHKAAVDYFIKYAGCDNDGNQLPDSPMKGGVVIFAAGNDAIENGAPANYEPIIAVGSIGPDYSRAYYSNYGSWVDIAAPGGDSYFDNGQIYSTLPDNKYGWMQGTSMACPHVSGVAALIVSYYGGQGFTNDMLKERLIGGARKDVLSSNAKIGPLADALGSIVYGDSQAPAPVGDYSVEAKANNLNFSWEVTSDKNGNNAYGFILFAAKDKALFSNLDYGNIPSGMSSTVVYSKEASQGDEISGGIKDLDFGTPYYTAIVAFSYGRNFSGLSEIKAVNTLPNNPPVIETSYTGDYRIPSHTTLTIPFTISDPDGHDFTVKYQPATTSAETFGLNSASGGYELKISGPLADAGVYTAHVIASDKWDSTDYGITFEILENHPPVVIKQIEDMILDAPGSKFSIDMSEYVEDPDGETLKYSIQNRNVSVLHINPKDNILNGTALDYGVASVTVTGADAKNKTAEFSFRVAIPDPEKPVTAYPNPVVDYLYVGTGALASTEITIRSETGSLIFRTVSDVSILNPAVIDMSGEAPGKYLVTVKIGDNEYNQTIVKK